MNCRYCVHYIYDNTTGIGDCDLDVEEPDTCEEFYDRESARNDAKLRVAPEGRD